MKHMRKIAAAAMVMSALAAGTVYAQNSDCRKKCNDAYATCQKSGQNADKCLATWHACKKKCTPAK